jgi:uncharacterized protein YrrD
MLEVLRIGASVHGAEDQRLGSLTRVIVEGASERVLGIVVDPGLLASGNALAPGGWERPRERVVSLATVASVRDDEIQLTCDAAAFAQLPLFENVHAVPVDATTADGRRFQPGELVNYLSSEFGLGGAPYLAPEEITHAEPPTAGAIGEGTAIWRLEPHERIGSVDRVLMDDATRAVSGVVFTHGLLRRHILLPVSTIASLEDGVIHVNLTDQELEDLPLYHPGH